MSFSLFRGRKMQNLFFRLLLFSAVGIFLVLETDCNGRLFLLLSIVTVLPGYLLSGRGYSRAAVYSMFIGLMFLSGYAGDLYFREYNRVSEWEPPDCYIDIEGDVTGFPVLKTDTTSIIIDVERIMVSREARKVNCRVIIDVKGDLREVFPGDKIRISARLYQIRGFRNFGTDAGYRYDFSRGVHYRGFSKSSLLVEVLKSKDSFFRYIGEARNRLRAELEMSFSDSENNRAFLEALLLGDRGKLSNNLKDALVEKGLYHYVAVSGAHIGAIIFLVITGAGFLGVKGRTASLLTLLPVSFFVVFSGSGIPSLRALLFFILVVIARYFSLDFSGVNLVSCIGSLLLLNNPAQIYNPGFVLTFVITIGILQAWSSFGSQEAGFIRRYLTVIIPVVLLLLPLSVYYFCRFSFLGVVIGIIVAPLVFLTLSAGFIVIIAPVTGPFILPLLHFLTDVFMLFTEIPLRGEFVAGMNGLTCLVAVVPAFLILLKGEIRFVRYSALIFYSAVIISIFVPYNPDNTEVTYLDVGQGDCAVCVFPGGDSLLIDGGGSSFSQFRVGRSVVLPFILKKRIRIKWVAVSHYHPDHCRGITEILGVLKPKELWLSSTATEDREFQMLMKVCRKDNVTVKYIYSGFRQFTGSSVVECLWPEKFHEGKFTSNNLSQVIRISAGKVKFLFTGDIEREAEERLSSLSGSNLRADVLKVAHHGSATSSGGNFLDRTGCAFAVISCGYRNRFGFPRQEVVDRLKERGISFMTTASVGAVRIGVENESFVVDRAEK